MSSSGAPCGACKFLRRKCVRGCIFAPHFGAEQGAARFAAVHKIFGASNVGKLLLHIPFGKRCDAVLTISYEAQARLSDPVYGCVATIFSLQQQVASLQAELAVVQAQLASRLAVNAIQQQQHHDGEGVSAYEQSMAPGMAVAGSSSVGAYGTNVAKEEAAYGHRSMHYLGHLGLHPNLEHLPSSPSEDNMDGTNASLQETGTESTDHQQHDEDVGDLQALAHALLCRK